MNFININKYILIFFLTFLFACKSTKNFYNKDEVIYNNFQKIENKDYIIIKNYDFNKKNYFDYYDNLNIHGFDINKEFVKIEAFNTFKKKYFDSKALNSFIKNDQFIYIDYKSILNIYDIVNKKFIKQIKLNTQFNNSDIYPTSIANIDNSYYVAYSSGHLVNFSNDGKIIWSKNFNTILKTPIKIFENNIIILLSSQIIAIDKVTGDTNWKFNYNNNNDHIQGFGGFILNHNHLLFFILPNNKIGELDTILVEKNKSLLSNIKFKDSMDNSDDMIHSYNEFISYLDNKKYLSTINLMEELIVYENIEIQNIDSFVFYKNALFVLDKNNLLNAYNIKNYNLFWQNNLSEYIKNKNEIISISSNSKSLIFFFKNGEILEINSINGEIISNSDLKLKNIKLIKTYDKYFLIYDHIGKITIFLR